MDLDPEAGTPQVFNTATGSVLAYGHMVDLEVLNLKFEAMVYFFADDQIHKNLLGRNGFLNRVRLGLIDHDCHLFLASYN